MTGWSTLPCDDYENRIDLGLDSSGFRHSTSARADALLPTLKVKAKIQLQAGPLELKVLPDQQQELRITYWDSDAGNRRFDIFMDDHKVATQHLENNKPERFYEEVYPLSSDLVQGKQTVTLKFQAADAAWAGGVLGVRITKVPSAK